MYSISSKVLTRYIIIALSALLFSTCATNPVTGKKEFMLVSESQEIAMGKEYDPQVVATYGVYPDTAINNYIAQLGQRIAKVSDRPDLPYEFKVLDSPVINAFAVPGGFVYFTRGILAYLNSEAEVAGVMGHEVGHIAARHSAKQISRQQIASLGLGIGSILSEDVAQLAGIAQSGIGILFLKFGRDAERQSDLLGVTYSTELGYDAKEMANFFRILERMEENSGSGLPGWLSTHPAPEERVQTIVNLAREAQAKYPNRNFVVKREEYLRKIDGLVFGEDPRQGYVEDNIFYHPELKFQFPVPDEWQVNNTPSQVQIVNKDQSAFIVFELSNRSSATDAAQQFLTQAKAQLISQDLMRVNAMNAVRTIADINSQNGIIRVMSYFIEYDNRVYVFHGVAGKSTFSRHVNLLENTMRGFNRLTNPQKINVQQKRIRIKKVDSTTTLENALQQFGVASNKMEIHSFINGMELGSTVQTNMLLKVIE